MPFSKEERLSQLLSQHFRKKRGESKVLLSKSRVLRPPEKRGPPPLPGELWHFSSEATSGMRVKKQEEFSRWTWQTKRAGNSYDKSWKGNIGEITSKVSFPKIQRFP
jgi:hypothetical protein